MAVKRNSFDGGTNTTAISTGNSGGVSGDAFDAISGTPAFSNTHAHSGTLAARFPPSALSRLNFNITTNDIYTRQYVWLQANVAQTLLLLTDAANAGGSSTGRISMLAGGTLEVGNASGSVTSLGATVVTLNQWVRIEGRFSTTTGCEARLYNSADSDVPSASATHATSIVGAVGSIGFRNGGTDTLDEWVDDIAFDTATWLGAAVDPAPRPPLSVPTAVHRASRW